MFKNVFKKSEGKPVEESAEESEKKEEGNKAEAGQETSKTPSLGSAIADIDRLKAQFDSFKEIRNVFSERFTRVSEQIGELRSMMIERDRDLQRLEAKSLKAIDMVESVQPEKLMVEMRKEDGKIEALRANLESNEAIMARLSDELKNIRNKMEVYKGIEQVMKMNEEVKAEIIDIKKVEATTGSHADKVETMFMEMRKRFKELEMFKDQLNEATLSIKEHENDLNMLKTKISELVKKEEFDELFSKLIKHVEDIKKRAGESPLSKDLDSLKSMIEELKL